MADEAPARLLLPLAELVADVVDEAIDEHEQRMHIPPPRRGKLRAIPFPNITLDDSQVCRAWEMLKLGATLDEAALALGVPDLVLERCLHELQPAWRKFLEERASGA